MFCYIFRLSLKQSYSKNKQTKTAFGQQLLGRDTFEFDQRHVTKKKPITVLILLSEGVAIYTVTILVDFKSGRFSGVRLF